MTWIFASVIFSKSISVPLIKSFIDITSERICHMYFHKTRTWSLLIAWLASNLQNVLQGILWLRSISYLSSKIGCFDERKDSILMHSFHFSCCIFMNFDIWTRVVNNLSTVKWLLMALCLQDLIRELWSRPPYTGKYYTVTYAQ